MRKESLKATIVALVEELAKLELLPEDDFVDGDVIQYRVRYPGREEPYTYVAVKIGGDWWNSGRQALTGWTTWDKLCETFGSGRVTELWYATGWEEIELP